MHQEPDAIGSFLMEAMLADVHCPAEPSPMGWMSPRRQRLLHVLQKPESGSVIATWLHNGQLCPSHNKIALPNHFTMAMPAVMQS